MKRLKFDYTMRIFYETAVSSCHYTIKCIPPVTDRQRLLNIRTELEPNDEKTVKSEDSFQNPYIYGTITVPHDIFTLHVKGEVETGLADCERVMDEAAVGKFRYPYGLAKAGPVLLEYVEKLKKDTELSVLLKEEASSYDKALCLMRRLYADYGYEKQVTDINTGAEEAFALGRGVCQDYSHILIALCRHFGIPARYVAGMMMGEGCSHAWIEVLSDGGWYGLDATNNAVADDTYIKLGVGRDANDCAINRGIVMGGGRQKQEVKVVVEAAV